MLFLMTVENHFVEKFGISIAPKSTFQERVKFIHASDIHLGAAQYRNMDRANDFINVFKEILEATIFAHNAVTLRFIAYNHKQRSGKRRD